MEGYVEGSGQICERWKKKHGFPGCLVTADILELQTKLKLEIMRAKNKAKSDKRKKEYRMSDKWLK